MYDVRGCTAHGLGADSTFSKMHAVRRCGEGASGVLRWVPLIRMVRGCAALICARQFLSRATGARGNAAQGTSLPTEESNVLELLWTSRVVRGCAARICARQVTHFVLFQANGVHDGIPRQNTECTMALLVLDTIFPKEFDQRLGSNRRSCL